MEGGAYGAGKAGGPFDPITFVQRPSVVLKALCLLFSIIVLWCVNSGGYQARQDGKEVCILDEDSAACAYGVDVAVTGLLAAAGFLAGEYLFEQMSSVKTRKHFVLIDLGFSGAWAFLYFIGFWYLTSAWNKSETPKENNGVNSIRAAIAFSFFCIFTWAASAWFAYQRFKQGTDAAFAPSYEAEPTSGAGYTSYPDANDQGYQEPPFGQQQQQQQQQQQKGLTDFQAPAY